MTVIEVTSLPELQPVVFDLYRDIHKGIRGELFALTTSAGQADPSDREARADLARHVDSVVSLLVAHAHHEDAAITPVLQRFLPDLAERIEADHTALDRRIAAIDDMAKTTIDAPGESRRFELHRVYLELSAFVSAYLAHIDLEERYVGQALEQVVGVEGVIGIHGSIIASLTPEEMATTLPLMFTGMNVDDQTELLGGMQAHAPAEVFTGVWGLFGSSVSSADRAVVARRLGVA
jgi:Hemerythrin HHE cation binding domain